VGFLGHSSGSTRAWRNNQMTGRKFFDRFDGDLVVAVNFNFDRRVHLAQSLNEVVGKGIVVVDDQDHENSGSKSSV